MSRVHPRDAAGAAWHPVPDIGDLGPGEVGGFLVAGVPILACRVGDDLFAYHDRCGRCHDSMAGAALHRPMGAPIGAGRAALPALPCAFRRRACRCGLATSATTHRISTRSRFCYATVCCRSRYSPRPPG